MTQKNYIILFLFLLLSTVLIGQEQNRIAIPNRIYSDRITDEFGKPLSGIQIRVKGKSARTYTDANGEFSINAKNGDVIILSKNGITI